MSMWDRTLPSLATKVRSVDDYFRDNFVALQDALGREHIFVGDGGSTEGQHNPGLVGILFVGATSACSALSAGVGIEGSGAIHYDTWTHKFNTWDGGAWVAYDFLQASGDTITAAWTVPGSYLDGRDPSVDGAALDSMSVSANEVAVWTGTVADGSTVNVHTVLPGWKRTTHECHIFVHNMNVWSFADSIKRLACSAADSSGGSGWTITSTVKHGKKGVAGGTNSHPDATCMIICLDRTP